ncbi:hypothetical protein H4R18_003463 [Coemansia javaensis]|uniref:Outer kinetochore protein DAD2 n=1 Tax=Coemansia javaensis TaxID=2761396 RepID=A0A9W8HC12_9FUNG|nr:hypothetical protein H4R18_003463 [Coemansia javaensis]
MSTQAIVDRLAQKKQELAALQRVKALSETTDAHCMELDRQMDKMVRQYETMLSIALGWSSAFENATLIDIRRSGDDDAEHPESVIRIPAEEA